MKGPSGEIMNYVSLKRDIAVNFRLEAIAEPVSTMDNIGYIFSRVRHEIGNPVNAVNMILGILSANCLTCPRSDQGIRRPDRGSDREGGTSFEIAEELQHVRDRGTANSHVGIIHGTVPATRERGLPDKRT